MMITAAPFDDWWHNAYGLDVRIVSPPHILLGMGMMGIVLGAMLRVLALQNSNDPAMRRRASRMFDLATGLFLTILALLLIDWSDRRGMDLGIFYAALSTPIPQVLVASTVAGRSHWPATTGAALYMLIVACPC